MPLGEIRIERLGSDQEYRVDDDALLQVVALAHARQLHITAVDGGKGYRVDNAPEGSVLQMAGLRVADEIVSLNGLPIGDHELLTKAYPLLRMADAITLTVKRNGETIALNYEVRRRRAARSALDLPERNKKRRRTTSKDEEKLFEGIKKTAEHHYQIKRETIDAVLENQDELMSLVRIVPVQEDGTDVGIRLFGIRNDMLLSKLGLKNGDLIESLNGHSLASPVVMLEAYGKLRSSSSLRLAIVRKGKPLTLVYDVID